jgi:hypothetical protein
MSSAPLSAPYASLAAAFVLTLSLALPVHAQEASATAENPETAEKSAAEQPNVDVWQYLASPFGDPPALPAAASPAAPTATAATAEAPRKWPEEYWNCLLLNLRGMGSDLATRLVAKACQEKYPQQ